MWRQRDGHELRGSVIYDPRYDVADEWVPMLHPDVHALARTALARVQLLLECLTHLVGDLEQRRASAHDLVAPPQSRHRLLARRASAANVRVVLRDVVRGLRRAVRHEEDGARHTGSSRLWALGSRRTDG